MIICQLIKKKSIVVEIARFYLSVIGRSFPKNHHRFIKYFEIMQGKFAY